MSDLYLAHHGRLGQRWGRKNGPPYPLDYTKLSAEEVQKAKVAAIERNDVKEAYLNRRYYTDSEINTLINRYDLEKKLNDRVPKETIKSGLDKFEDAMTVALRVGNAVDKGTKAYNPIAKVLNSVVGTDLPIIGEKPVSNLNDKKTSAEIDKIRAESKKLLEEANVQKQQAESKKIENNTKKKSDKEKRKERDEKQEREQAEKEQQRKDAQDEKQKQREYDAAEKQKQREYEAEEKQKEREFQANEAEKERIARRLEASLGNQNDGQSASYYVDKGRDVWYNVWGFDD